VLALPWHQYWPGI